MYRWTRQEQMGQKCVRNLHYILIAEAEELVLLLEIHNNTVSVGPK